MKIKRLLLAMFLPMLFVAFPALAQDKTVTGKVTDAKDGAAIQGVSVLVKGTKSTGTQTASDGTFKIKVNNGAILVFSSVGYVSQEVAANDNVVNVSLTANSTGLGDVVVVGYGTARKKDLTGSTSSVSSKDFNNGAITNPLQQIAGKAAGVVVSVQGSEPGVAPNVRIRGINSIAGGNDPLVVIDGIQSDLSILGQIPPSEIESMDILKDGSATAIYGSRGNGGVILVTTKKGKNGTFSIDYNGVASFESISKKYEVLNAQQWRDYKRQNNLTGAQDFGGNTNWVDAITRNGFTQTHNIGFGSGSGNFNYRASLAAILQDGIVINSGNKTYIGRIQLNQKGLDGKLNISMNLNSSMTETKWNNAINNAYNNRPTDPIYFQKANGGDSDVYFVDRVFTFGYLNSYARAKEIIDGRKLNTLFGSLRADLEVSKGLTLGFFGSWEKRDNVTGYYAGRRTTIEGAINDKGWASRGTNLDDTKLMDLSINYKKKFGNHNLDATFVYEYQRRFYEGFNVSARGFLNDILSFNALQSADITRVNSGDISSYANEQILASFLGRINYSYADKYFATVSVRRDGSSKFGDNNKWGTFPSVSLAWRLTKENFMSRQSLFNDLKLRAGFGITGNQDGFGPLASRQLVSPSGTTYFGGQLIPNYTINQIANPDLKWEERTSYNVGIDFSLLKSRLTGSIDYYNNTTNGLLASYQVPSPPFPVTSIFGNAGSLSNKGIELGLTYRVVSTKDFTFNISGNISKNINTVESLKGTILGTNVFKDSASFGTGYVAGVTSGTNDVSYIIQGKPLATFVVLRRVGVDANGNEIYDNPTKSGKVDATLTSKDKYEAGSALPDFTYAITPSFTYKNFDLNMVFRGVQGNKIYNSKRSELNQTAAFARSNMLTEALTNKVSSITYPSDFWLEDGSFLRLDNITLGYKFDVAKFKYISNLRLYVTANNVFVITKYKGIDPELAVTGTSGSGIDGGIYPRTRNFAIGLNVSFK